MRIYFGEANWCDVDEFGEDGMFKITKNDEPRWFYQGVEHGTNAGGIEEVRIFDGCNRSIPISVDTIPQLVEALNYCYNNYNTLKYRETLLERIESDEEAYVLDSDDFAQVYDAENSEEDEF